MISYGISKDAGQSCELTLCQPKQQSHVILIFARSDEICKVVSIPPNVHQVVRNNKKTPCMCFNIFSPLAEVLF